MDPTRLMTLNGTLITRSASGVDQYGGALLTDTEIPVMLWFGSPTTEERGGQVASVLTVYMPPGVGPLDQVTAVDLPGLGRWEVDGNPVEHVLAANEGADTRHGESQEGGVMGHFDYDQSFPDELGNDAHFRRWLLARGIDVRQGIKRELPVSWAGGRRVAPFATRAYAEVDGLGRQVECEVGTRWRVAPIIEWGSRYSPAYAPLRKSALAAGLNLTGGSG